MSGYEELKRLVDSLRYRREWTFNLEPLGGVGEQYLLRICALVENSESPSGHVRAIDPGYTALGMRDFVVPQRLVESRVVMRLVHSIPVPHAPDQDAAFWRHWLFHQVLNVERHEAAEWFMVDGERPFFPDHSPGGNPYAIKDRLS